MMHIDPRLGRHAAANLSDAELRRLMEIAAWELAVRSSDERYRALADRIVRAPEHAAEEIAAARSEREAIRFAEEVLRDIASLPGVA